MLVETAIAALALFVWLLLEPGLVRAICFNVMLIAGVSTLVFNGNPLLRFDGYYILADLLEIPNLAPALEAVLTEWSDRTLFECHGAPAAAAGARRAAWFALYQPLRVRTACS